MCYVTREECRNVVDTFRRYSSLAGSPSIGQADLFADKGGRVCEDFGMRDQIQRAAVSLMANIADGFDCDSNTELARFLGIARRSAVEVQSLLYAALDIGYIADDQFKLHYAQADKAKALTSGFKHAMLHKKTPKP